MDQDWNTVIIYGNQKHNRPKPKQNSTISGEENNTVTVKRITRQTAAIIRNGRIARGFRTQKDLANATGISVKVINEYESGRAIIDNSILQRLRNTLNIKIPVK